MAEANAFNVFLTIDQNLAHQQNVVARSLGFIVVKVPDNNIQYYEPLFPRLNEAALKIRPGEIIYISSPLS